MTRTTVSATRPDKTGAGEWIDIHSRTGRLMSTLMADGQPFSIDCLCSMVLRPVERLVFSPKER